MHSRTIPAFDSAADGQLNANLGVDLRGRPAVETMEHPIRSIDTESPNPPPPTLEGFPLLRFALILSVVLTARCPAEDDFTSLFNGKDLTGWKGDQTLWSVEDGAITGRTNGPDHLSYNKFLIWDGTAADFEFRCEFRLEGANNSGVQYRSVHDKERGEFVCVGYQADIHSKAEYTGMLYDEKGRGIIARRGQKVVVGADGKKEATPLETDMKALDLTKWHELTIIARGNRLIHKVDGNVTVDITDNQSKEAESDGVIALQVHRGKAMVAQFRNLRLRKFAKVDAQKKNAKADDKQATAQWVWLNENGTPTEKVFLRKEINSSGVSAARLFAVADDSVKVFLDGKQVLSSDSWQEPVFADVSGELDLDSPQKKHVLAVEATNGGGAAGALVKLDLDSGWRDAWSITTDGTWLASTVPQPGWKTIDFRPNATWGKPDIIAPLGKGPWSEHVNADRLNALSKLRTPTATPVDRMKVAKGFNVELLYSVPKDKQGSWVNMCVDPKGRLIVSDQYGSLYRVTPPGILGARQIVVEPINVDIGEAQGLLWAFDSLYVSVNRGKKYAGGFYRVRDTDGDDQLDSLETLRSLTGSGEHGPHAVLPHPDGRNLVVVCGNRTELTEITGSMVSSWDEDLLLPRAEGKFMKGTRAPGGCIYKVDPDGKTWEVMASGFRNQYDAAYTPDGELFTYDADMEWDVNTPWYRPTRICHVVAGGEFGWRSGGGKWPVHYPDSVPPVVNIGPGSPTGVCFGHGSQFPRKYQNALFACDWSYGKMYAVHLTAAGGTFTGELEEFITGTPLPLTDVVVNPVDGAMYFAIGGRKVQSGLYKVTSETVFRPPSISSSNMAQTQHLKQRRQLESMLESNVDMDAVWTGLGSSQRAIRYAARTVLEKQPTQDWADRTFTENNPQTKLTALLAYVRSFERSRKGESPNIDSPIPDWSKLKTDPERAATTVRVLKAIQSLPLNDLSEDQWLQMTRIMTLTFVRISPPPTEVRDRLVEHLEGALPSRTPKLNSEFAQLLVYLQAPYAAEKILSLLESAPTQEEQIDYARTLRHLKTGWTPELQQTYFAWFTRAASFQGGSSFQLFVNNIKRDAVAQLTDEAKTALQPILDAQPESTTPVFTGKPRTFVKEWTMDELVPLLESELVNRDFEHGRQMFGAASCFACHQFDNQGGSVGPDLTSLSGRFSSRDILESVMEPSKQISDQYGSVQIITIDGKVVNGRIVNLAGDAFRVQTDMLRPGQLTSVDRKQIEEILESKVSMMPAGLLNTLTKDEILDLMAFLLSRGDRENAMFK